jgi:hypothetical protein
MLNAGCQRTHLSPQSMSCNEAVEEYILAI